MCLRCRSRRGRGSGFVERVERFPSFGFDWRERGTYSFGFVMLGGRMRLTPVVTLV